MLCASGGNPLFRSCIASIFPTPHTPHPIPCLVFSLFVTPSGGMGILPVRRSFLAGRMPTLLLFSAKTDATPPKFLKGNREQRIKERGIANLNVHQLIYLILPIFRPIFSIWA
ncbi:hypothetical protein [Moorena producens]|uniref:hypothetical protein n=1 Tax=Moorena producens TaxID=1155739 RepID=UPI0011EA66F3|nr:hypothetical protein [Moorena producens]